MNKNGFTGTCLLRSQYFIVEILAESEGFRIFSENSSEGMPLFFGNSLHAYDAKSLYRPHLPAYADHVSRRRLDSLAYESRRRAEGFNRLQFIKIRKTRTEAFEI